MRQNKIEAPKGKEICKIDGDAIGNGQRCQGRLGLCSRPGPGTTWSCSPKSPNAHSPSGGAHEQKYSGQLAALLQSKLEDLCGVPCRRMPFTPRSRIPTTSAFGATSGALDIW